MTETREAEIVREVLAGYGGVLVSDFYPGYDSVPCRQQKCLVHLIRDLNDDLWKAPFDRVFEAFVLEVRKLLVPALEAVDLYGLKTWHLRKFGKDVDRFYSKTIIGRAYASELVVTYQKRFQRYRENLFTFLSQDGIPWNNNMAERAIRQLAVQRKFSGTFFKRVAPQYLLLLAISQTCRFQGKSFLKFLLSKAKNVDEFSRSRPIKYSAAMGDGRPDRRLLAKAWLKRLQRAGAKKSAVKPEQKSSLPPGCGRIGRAEPTGEQKVHRLQLQTGPARPQILSPRFSWNLLAVKVEFELKELAQAGINPRSASVHVQGLLRRRHRPTASWRAKGRPRFSCACPVRRPA